MAKEPSKRTLELMEQAEKLGIPDDAASDGMGDFLGPGYAARHPERAGKPLLGFPTLKEALEELQRRTKET